VKKTAVKSNVPTSRRTPKKKKTEKADKNQRAPTGGPWDLTSLRRYAEYDDADNEFDFDQAHGEVYQVKDENGLDEDPIPPKNPEKLQ
jgi:hypothetical protein